MLRQSPSLSAKPRIFQDTRPQRPYERRIPNFNQDSLLSPMREDRPAASITEAIDTTPIDKHKIKTEPLLSHVKNNRDLYEGILGILPIDFGVTDKDYYKVPEPADSVYRQTPVTHLNYRNYELRPDKHLGLSFLDEFKPKKDKYGYAAFLEGVI